ncbi:hypothetical protein [Sporosarcina beigongshangi]|uniref:hypothetical protein n=1 Tax=Sporosarcina beigongshangi TaxID=2782538 RepID=UPI0019392B10|nr:hypothetical protein [Sporosarcina beigongshangi]
MDPEKLLQGQQLQQQLRQLELQLEIHQQQLEEHRKPKSNSQEMEQKPAQPVLQQQEPAQPESQQQEPVQPESQQQEPAQPESQQQEPAQPESQQQEPAQPESQQQKAQKQLPTYYTAPEMISTQDIGYLRDMLSSNLLAVKQYRQAIKDCQLPDLKLQFKEASQMHLQHYNSLLSFLSENGGVTK